MAANTNGLIGSRDVNSTGARNSNFFLRKGAPIESPLQILSPDRTKIGSIRENDDGSLLIQSGFASIVLYAPNGDVALLSPDSTKVSSLSTDNNGSLVLLSNSVSLQPANNFAIVTSDGNGGNGRGFLVKPANQINGIGAISLYNSSYYTLTPTYYTTYNSSVTGNGLVIGNLQTFGYKNGSIGKQITSFVPDGSSAVLGDDSIVGGTVVSVNGSLGLGRVFDTLYNLPPAPIAPRISTVFTSTQVLSPGTFTSPNFSISAGTYLLQANYNLQNTPPVYSLPSPGSIGNFLQLAGSFGGEVRYSSFNVTTSMLTSPNVSTSNQFTFVSGIFSIPNTALYFLGSEIDGDWNFGNGGDIEYQLVKLA